MREFYEQVLSLENLLISQATGHAEDSGSYTLLRQVVLSQTSVDSLVPSFLRTCRTLGQFWEFIKSEYGTYAERRRFIWAAFHPLLEVLESGGPSPSDSVVSTAIETFDSAHVQSAWSKALDRRSSDPEGAITAARSLLESVCKHILDEANIEYGEGPDLGKLYRLTAEHLKLAPSQHTEHVFKQILGGCTAVIEGLGALRNRLSDSHGKGKVAAKPAARHAELAVNLAGSLAMFLLSTYKARNEGT